MKVTHVVPEPSLFGAGIESIATQCGHACLRYRLSRNPLVNAIDLLRLLRHCRASPGTLFVFHWVPHYRIALLRALVRDFRYSLHYWGIDYYWSFLDEIRFERHCLRKSPLLDAANYRRRAGLRQRLGLRALRLRIGLHVVAHADAVLSLTRTQFRLVRWFHLRTTGKPLGTPRTLIRSYAQVSEGPVEYTGAEQSADEITVLICHSATASVAPGQALELLKRYRDRWAARIHVRGFLSYSGGSESDRDALERALRERAAFAESIELERKFVGPDVLRARLAQCDVALFACLRDEGVGMLTLFVRMGGAVACNRFSFDYDFFREIHPEKLLSHEQFLERSPGELRLDRLRAAAPPPALLEYRALGADTPR